jgi:hypothetical protein
MEDGLVGFLLLILTDLLSQLLFLSVTETEEDDDGALVVVMSLGAVVKETVALCLKRVAIGESSMILTDVTDGWCWCWC